jgi:hypothetical protein
MQISSKLAELSNFIAVVQLLAKCVGKKQTSVGCVQTQSLKIHYY